MSLGNLALSGARAALATTPNKQVANIIEFIEEPWGLGMRLFPVQKVILKAHYGLELDDTTKFKISDRRRQNFFDFTEKEYLEYLYNEGRSNLKEVIPGRDRREMVLSIGRRSGKCVTGDTLVLTDRGVYTIENLGDPEGPEVQPLDVGVVQEGAKLSRSAYFYNGGTKPTYRIVGYSGVAVEGTENHRVRVMTTGGTVGWKRLDEIKPGDTLAVHRTSNLWASDYVDVQVHHVRSKRKNAAIQPKLFDARWGLLMGYLVGDGSWTNRSSIAVTVEHPETRAEVESLLVELCGKVSLTHDKRTPRTGAVRAFDKALRHFLHNLGFDWGCAFDTKRTPWVILRSPRDVVCAYLQGLFETDGTVSKNGQVVSFCSASPRLVRETQVLLLNFGVVSRIRVKYNKKLNRNYHELIIHGLRSRTTFAREIGFRSSKKQGPLEAGLLVPRRESGDAESIPHQRYWVSRLLASVPKQRSGGGWRRSALRAVLSNVCKPGSQEDLTYSRIDALLPVASELGADPEALEHFRALRRADYFYDPVVSVTQGYARVYDLNVPDGESFVANGLTNHNTTLSAAVAAYETYKLILKGDPQSYYGLPQSNMIQLISIATDKEQAGLLYQEVSGHFRNCFAPETEVITADGVKPIGSLAGTTQTLLTPRGWVEAPIRSFGRQPLYKLTLARQGVEKVIYTTANHRWFARDVRKAYRGKGFHEFTTVELRPGKHHLQSIFGHSRQSFLEHGGSTVARDTSAWTVKSVEPTDRVEEVYCATVDGVGAFALGGNILTGNCPFFSPYMANNTMSYARFQTPKDIERYGSYQNDPNAKATIKVTFRSCVAKGLRGAGNIVVILDEVAHFTDAGQSSADAVYNAVIPSTSAYSPKDPNNHRVPIGPVEARVILISSPLGRQGLFYKLFMMGMGGGPVSENMLCIQAPTWEVNPTVPASEFEKHYLKDPAVFFTEYGGEFSDRTRGWIEREEDLEACINKDLRPQVQGIPRRPYFLGLDLGLVGDGTAVAIGHINVESRIQVDYIDQIKAGEGKYVDKTRLEFDDIADWIKDLANRFNIVEGIFDQWAGIPLEQALMKRGLNQMKAVQMTKQLASQMFQNFKDMMWDKRVILYDFPIPPNERHCSYIKELLELQARYHSKYVTTVEAPNVEGKHDDLSDALVRMVWSASNRLAKQPHIASLAGSAGRLTGGGSLMAARKRMLRSGSHESRMIGPRRRPIW